MNLKKLSVAALAALTLFSCTKEVIVEKEVPVPQETGTSRIKLSLDASTITKAPVINPDNHYGMDLTPDEGKIYNYSVFIFNANGILEASLVASPYNGTPGSEKNYATDYTSGLTFDHTYLTNGVYMDQNNVITLSAGQKYFFALINAPEKLLTEQNEFINNNTLNQSKIQEETLSMDKLQLIVGEYTNGDGTTFTNDISTTGNRGFMMTTLTNLQAQRFDPMEEDDPAEPVTLTVGRAMSKVSLASALTDASQPNGKLTDISYKVVNNPEEMNVVPAIQNNVLTTPYYYNTAVNDGSYFDSTSDYLPASILGNLTATYCIENANRTPKQGNSTAAIVKGKYAPEFLYDEDGQSMGAPTNAQGTFWRLRDKNNKTYYINYFGEEPTAQTISDKNTESTNASTTGEVYDYEAIEYTNGECYYIIYLYNEDNTTSPYTVKRNSYYRIDVVSVEGAGEPGPGDLIDPEEPIEEQSDITVTITIDEWEPVNQEGKL